MVEQRLAACVNLFPQVESCYRWKGEIHQDAEVFLVIKSRRALFERLHSYEVPELIAVPIVDGAEAYLGWMEKELAEE